MTLLGPSGLVLGTGPRGQVAMRIFRPKGTRLALGAPEYVSWLVAYRAGALGAHLTVLGDAGPWGPLLERLGQAGISVEASRRAPDQGYPYRPSLILGDPPPHVGPWQAHVGLVSPDDAAGRFRSADLALVTPDDEMAGHLRRAFHLTGGQLRAAAALSENQVAFTTDHRLVRVTVRPGPLEYRALFG